MVESVHSEESDQVGADFSDFPSNIVIPVGVAKQLIEKQYSLGNNSPLCRMWNSTIINKIENEVRQRSKQQPLIISQFLDPEQENLLQRTFADFNLQFSRSSKFSHGYAAASRTCELHRILQLISYDKIPLKEDNTYICDLGGNYATHLKALRSNIHSCNPILDIRDEGRRVLRDDSLEQFFNTHNIGQSLYQDFKTNRTKYTCDRIFGECNIAARYVISIHSLYDVTQEEFARGMVNKGASIAYASFMFSSEILIKDNGTFKDLEVEFFVNRTNNTIRFDFVGDNSYSYTHNLNTYLAWIVNGQFSSTDGRACFLTEVIESRGSVKMIRIVRIMSKVPSSRLTHNQWFEGASDKYVIRYPKFEVGMTELYNLRWITVIAPKEMVEKVRAYAQGVTETKFKPIEIFNYLRSYSSRVFFGKDVIHRYETIPTADMVIIAQAIYVEVYISKYNQGKLLQQQLKDIEYNRALAAGSLWDKITLSRSDVITASNNFMTGWLHRILYQLKSAPVPETYVTDKATKYSITVDTTEFGGDYGVVKDFPTPVIIGMDEAVNNVLRYNGLSAVVPNGMCGGGTSKKPGSWLRGIIKFIVVKTLKLIKIILTNKYTRIIAGFWIVEQIIRLYRKLRQIFDEPSGDIEDENLTADTRIKSIIKQRNAKKTTTVARKNDETIAIKVTEPPKADSKTGENRADIKLRPSKIISAYNNCLTDGIEFTETIVPGDGYCLYHSLAVGSGMDHTGLLKKLWEDADPSNSQLIEELDSYGGTNAIEQYNRTFGKSVCVHHDKMHYHFLSDTGNDIIHLKYNGNHYNRLELKKDYKNSYIKFKELFVGTTGSVAEFLLNNPTLPLLKTEDYDYEYYGTTGVQLAQIACDHNTPINDSNITIIDYSEDKTLRKISNGKFIDSDIIKEQSDDDNVVKCDLVYVDQKTVEDKGAKLSDLKFLGKRFLSNNGRLIIKLKDCYDLSDLTLESSYSTVDLYRSTYTEPLDTTAYIIASGYGLGYNRFANPIECYKMHDKLKSKSMSTATFAEKISYWFKYDHKHFWTNLSGSSMSFIPSKRLNYDFEARFTDFKNNTGFDLRLIDYRETPPTDTRFVFLKSRKRCEFPECSGGGVFNMVAHVRENNFTGSIYALFNTADANECLRTMEDKLDCTITVYHQKLFRDSNIILGFHLGKVHRLPLISRLNNINHHRFNCRECVDDSEPIAFHYDPEYRIYYDCYYEKIKCTIKLSDVIVSADMTVGFKNFSAKAEDGLAIDDTVKITGHDYTMYVHFKTATTIDPASLKRALKQFKKRTEHTVVGEICWLVDQITGLETVEDYLTTKCSILYKVNRNGNSINKWNLHWAERLLSLGTTDDRLPDYIDEVYESDVTRNAAIEIRHVWNYTLKAINNNLVEDFEIYKCHYYSKVHPAPLHTKDVSFGIIDVRSKLWYLRPADLESGTSYQCAFDGVGLLDIDLVQADRLNFKYTGDAHLLAVNKDTKIVNSDKFYAAVATCPVRNYTMPDLEVIEGLPGGGKTKFLIEHVDIATDLVLTATRESAAAVMTRLRTKHGKLENYNRVMTGDSFLINYKTNFKYVNTLWVDEGFMKHAGELFWYCFFAQPRFLKVLGDSVQIPYLSRNCDLILRYKDLSRWRKSVTYLAVSYRCPSDVIFLIQEHYNYKLFTKNDRRETLSVEKISNVSGVPYIQGAQYLTFKQREKTQLIHIGHANTKTVHEYQGSETDFVVVVRLDQQPHPIYKRKEHWVVAISRHRQRFTYATVVIDEFAQWIRKPVGKSSTDKVIWKDLQGGGVQYPDFEPDLIPASTVDHVKANNIALDIIESNAYPGLIPLKVKQIEIPVYSQDIILTPQVEAGDINTLQMYYDMIVPDNSLYDRKFDQEIQETDDFHITVGGFNIDYCTHYKRPIFDTLSANLRTNMSYPVIPSQRQVIKAFVERNGQIPEIDGIYHIQGLASRVMTNFLYTYIDEQNIDVFKNYLLEPVYPNVVDITDWLSGQPTGISVLVEDADKIVDHTMMTDYQLIMKRMPKPILECTGALSNPSSQTIAFHDKVVNAIFCPVVREVKRRLINIMAKNFIIYTDMSNEEFEKVVNARIPPTILEVYTKHLEVDFSKYDKSQKQLALEIETRFLHYFGVPDELLDLWVYAHKLSRLVDRAHRFRATVLYQRKSGDAMTFLGNTVLLMSVLAYTYKLKDTYACFSGDDSYIFSRSIIPTLDDVEAIADIFNLEAKLLNFKYPYFCSRFLLPADDYNWVFIPDPLKVLTKLGRNDVANFEHVEEYRISLKDLITHYSNATLNDIISDAINDRYDTNYDYSLLISTLSNMVNDPTKFASLYNQDPDTILNLNKIALNEI